MPVRTGPPDPQHSTDPPTLTPHVYWRPALSEANAPSGGDDWPHRSLPQQAIEPSARTPQLWSSAAPTAVKEPPGGEACPAESSPQQAMEPLSRTPQECFGPELTELKEPEGGDACPELSLPQHTTVPPAPIAHACPCPVLKDVNEPVGGGDASPLESLSVGEQASEPSALIPQTVLPPTLNEVKRPSGAESQPTPQHAMEPSVRIAQASK